MNIELLEKTRDQILSHPDQVNMQDWFNHKNGLNEEAGGCGTAACIAGWALFVANNAEKLTDLPIPFDAPARRAKEALWLSDAEADRLFFTVSWPSPFGLALLRARTDFRTTTAYAQVVADRIDHFIKTEGWE